MARVSAHADQDEPRHEVAARGLTPAAVTHLTRDALSRIDLANVAPVKKLLKRFFSDAPWTAGDDDALAELVGPGEGWWRHALDEDFDFEFGWRDGAFRLAVCRRASLDDTFDGTVTPEATPNPRTIRFVTGPIHDGPSRWYASSADVDDPRVVELFADFDDLENVLIGPDFVAIGLRRPDRWEDLLAPVLRAVTDQFTGATPDIPIAAEGAVGSLTERAMETRPQPAGARGGGVERAWRELAQLRAEDPDDLTAILAAVGSPDVATRQVAARLLIGADSDTASAAWDCLLDDPSRSVRRATIDAMVDTGRSSLRPLLERALRDADAWARWKSLRGLVELGAGPSRAAVLPLAEDPDFRVRLEAAGALRAV